MTLGLVQPTRGTAHIGGVPYEPLHAAPGERRDHLPAALAAAESDRVDEVLGQVARPAEAAGCADSLLGMRQRLGIAAALLGDRTC